MTTDVGRGVAFARAALAGNPSDGYGGAVLAISFGDLRAAVEARRGRDLSIEPPIDLIAATVERFARSLTPSARATAIE